MKASQVSSFYFRQGLRFVLEQPRQWLVLSARKIFLLANRWEIAETYGYYYFAEKYAVLRLAFIDFRFVFVLGMVGGVACWLAMGMTELHVFFLAYAGSLVMFFITSRYRLPLAIPLLIMGAWYLARELPAVLVAKRRLALPGQVRDEREALCVGDLHLGQALRPAAGEGVEREGGFGVHRRAVDREGAAQ